MKCFLSCSRIQPYRLQMRQYAAEQQPALKEIDRCDVNELEMQLQHLQEGITAALLGHMSSRSFMR